jgi:parallel beta-helix repeat protein
VVQGNKIGTDLLGITAVPNPEGVRMSNSVGNLVGGAQSGEGNLISGNLWDGIRLEAAASGNRIQGNYIGTVVTGNAPLANGERGINVRDGASLNRIGVETDAAEGNVISGNTKEGILITGAGSNGNVVAGNWIGTNTIGTTAVGNAGGIQINGGAKSNVIGTNGDGSADTLEGNLISGNIGRAIYITGSGTDSTVVAGNRIGTKADGNLPLANGRSIEVIVGPDSSRIGTNGDGVSDSGESNVIAGNLRGILISGATNSVLAGNLIGIGPTGAQLGNGSGSFGAGVFLTNSATGTRVGTDGNGVGDSEEANVIAFNSIGVLISGANSIRNSIRGNSIHSNVGLGIDLGEDGVTPNDAGDTDTGANGQQNFPIIASAASSGMLTTIEGTLNAAVNTTFRLDFFSTATADPSGFGEGDVYLGSAEVSTDNAGNISFVAALPVMVPEGHFVSATATDASGNTSEFSGTVVVTETVNVNMAPAGTDGSVTTNEDANYTFVTDDFGFTDPDDTPANTLLAITITTLPVAGTLRLNGAPIAAGQSVAATDISAGQMTFAPAANESGNGYASFTFQVQDDGGTDGGGVDLDASPNTITIDVLPAPFYDFSAGSFSSAEGNAANTTNVVTVFRSVRTDIASSVQVVLSSGASNGATVGSDFTAGPIVLNFAVGETSQKVLIEVLGDSTVEVDETIDLSFANINDNGNFGLAHPTSTLTILNDDTATLSISDVSQVSG